MTQTQPWTLGRLLTWTTDYLRQHGADSARLDSELLLAHARGCQRIELYTAYDEVAEPEVRTAFRELVRRRAEGTPVAYLVGHREFYSLSFLVTPDVLIPRPETELLVLELLELVQKYGPRDRTVQIADVGTGSGAIAVCAARHAGNSRVTAIDVSPSALEVARQNVERHAAGDRIELLESDLLAALPADRKFDYIVSNPPYVSQSELQETPPEVKDHEPHTALLAGPTGTEVIARLVPQAAERLTAGGWLLLEISPMIETPVHQLLAHDGRFDTPHSIKDLAGLIRVVKARRQ